MYLMGKQIITESMNRKKKVKKYRVICNGRKKTKTRRKRKEGKERIGDRREGEKINGVRNHGNVFSI